MGAIIKCCKGCTKRFPGCHAQCEEYIAQKAEHDAKMAAYNKERNKLASVDYQKYDGMYKAMAKNTRRR